MANVLRAGVIGTGAVADACHLPAYNQLSAAEVVAVADSNLDRAEAMAKKYAVPIVCQDYRELLRREEIEAVSICTPTALHREQALAALLAGKHVLCETPLALRSGDCRELIQAAQSRGVILMPALTHRFYQFIQRAKEILAEGVIGRPFLFRARFQHDGPYQSWAGASDWYYDQELAGGGALMDRGGHALDLFRYFMGDAEAVTADTATLVKEIALDDTAICFLHGAGARGVVEAGWCSKEKQYRIQIQGTGGILLVDYRTPLRLYTPDAGWQSMSEPAGGGARAQCEHFVACCLQGVSPLVTGEDGLRAVALTRAAYESARTGRLITL